LHVCKFSDVIFTIIPLDKTDDLNYFKIVFPKSEYLVRNWFNYNLQENVLYLPTVENLESGDHVV
jgi:hypothetical protein